MRYVVLVLICSCLFATTSPAQFIIDQATFTEANSRRPALASSPDGSTAMAFTECGDLLMSFVNVQIFTTWRMNNYPSPQPVVLNAGTAPVICWSWTGYRVAFSSGDMILIYHADEFGNWDLENFTKLSTNGYVRGLEILGTSWDSDGPDVFLAVHTFIPGSEETHYIQFASCDENGWTSLESLDLEPQMANPQLAFHTGSYTPTPELFYHGGENYYDLHLKSTVLTPSNGWTTPSLVIDHSGTPSPILGEFDVATSYYTGNINILGLGMQPTCPCGTIYHHAYHAVIGTWGVENMTAHYSHYDWPMSPKIVTSEEGFGHAFWYQLATGEDFEPYRKTLEYRTFENDIWIDAGDFLDEPGRGGPLGERVALSVDPQDNPVLAWTRLDTIDGEPQPEQIWIARHFCPSAVPESETVKPLLALSAWPNPFNPQVTIAFEIDHSQAVRLDVFDARGRQVTNLLDGVVDAGHAEISWDARNDSGRRVPSGVYFARLISGDQKTVLKLVLAE